MDLPLARLGYFAYLARSCPSNKACHRSFFPFYCRDLWPLVWLSGAVPHMELSVTARHHQQDSYTSRAASAAGCNSCSARRTYVSNYIQSAARVHFLSRFWLFLVIVIRQHDFVGTHYDYYEIISARKYTVFCSRLAAAVWWKPSILVD